MAPRIPASVRRLAADRRIPSAVASSSLRPVTTPVCFFCALSRHRLPARHRTTKSVSTTNARFQSSIAAAAAAAAAAAPNADIDPLEAAPVARPPREELHAALSSLRDHAANFVPLSRVQLAINGLQQLPGHESVRVAVLGLNDGSEASSAAKDVLKLLLADPLKSTQEWEAEVDAHDLSEPLIIHVGPHARQELSFTEDGAPNEIHVSSPALNGHNLELLLMESPPLLGSDADAVQAFADSLLTPTFVVPAYAPITTPVHRVLLVGDGFASAATLASLARLDIDQVVATAVDIPDYRPADTTTTPFTPIDAAAANTGLQLIRQDVAKAMDFEHLWYQSNLPKLADWLKAGVLNTADARTKPAVKTLVESVLRDASVAIAAHEADDYSEPGLSSLGGGRSSAGGPQPRLQASIAEWAERAHGELQQELDLAFTSRRWRRLGWWKLFWRVDDVAMLTTDILNQRFLPASERRAIYLAGRMDEAGVPLPPASAPAPAAADPSSATAVTADNPAAAPPAPESTPATNATAAGDAPRWPTQIPSARARLQGTTVPALQALAQRLVAQALGTTGLTAALGGLVYVGTLTTSLYEAGAVAALGAVWSLRRMQRRWDQARAYWQGEVREEGRLAVREVERAVSAALVPPPGASPAAGTDAAAEDQARLQARAEREAARELVVKAQRALERLD